MIPRKRFDISWADLLFGIRCCFVSERRELTQQRLEDAWSSDGASLACLSVRSGFDALLHALKLPEGSEILVSALTIRDMIRIIEAHGLVPVPIDLDMRQLALRRESLAHAVTPRTKAILVAHLFGSRMPMDPVLQAARENNLWVLEDCAQAYGGNDYRGHRESDVSMFSFGPIKTATALAGGMLCFRDRSLRNQVQTHQTNWPIQSRWSFLRRICKYCVLILLSYRTLYSLFTMICRVIGKNHDQIISGSLRGFAGKDFFTRIRRRPSAPLLALLERRLKHFDSAHIQKRAQIAMSAIDLLDTVKRPGEQAQYHTHWVFPIQHEFPEQLMRFLWTRGFDATRGASSFCVVDPPTSRPEMTPTEARKTFVRLVYLPVYVGVSRSEVQRLAHAISDFNAGNGFA